MRAARPLALPAPLRPRRAPWARPPASALRGLVTAQSPKQMKRFYDGASAGLGEGGTWQVFLQVSGKDRVVRTPKRTVLELPCRITAEAVAKEWRSQGEYLQPLEMPMTTLGCTAVDLVRPQREACIDRMMPYLSMDTVCFEDDNEQLAEQQAAEWGPLRSRKRFGVELKVARGLLSPGHPEATLDTVTEQFLERDDWELCALEVATNTAKSLIVATSLLDRSDVAPSDALQWAMLEERFQIDRWGLVEGEHDVKNDETLRWLEACQRFAVGRRAGAE
ncbi:unnamed protein product [Prorocentrum cordatum]|uniref:ATP synthase mitochondrial F1 complex assembly factor 2 n=1 Tax=Prorocentrum cordatum TaxID=2364126 RepID=A0ABN9UW50_9DINO|nr:unnamed protein product [Polarella glacialis]